MLCYAMRKSPVISLVIQPTNFNIQIRKGSTRGTLKLKIHTMISAGPIALKTTETISIDFVKIFEKNTYLEGHSWTFVVISSYVDCGNRSLRTIHLKDYYH